MPDGSIENQEERVLLLRQKAERERVAIPDEVLEYIASKHSLRQTLKGALVQVVALAQRRQAPIDMALARRALGDAPLPVGEPAADPSSPGNDPAEDTRPDGVTAAGSGAAGQGDRDPLGERADASGTQGASDQPKGTETPVELKGRGGPGEQLGWESLERPPTVPEPPPLKAPAKVYFAPVRTTGKNSLVGRAGRLLDRAGLSSAIEEGDLVAIKLHFGEMGNTAFVHPVFVREVVARVKAAGGRPFLTDSNTLYRGQRFNAVDHITCAIRNGFGYATVEAPIVIADGLDGREAVDVPVAGRHFDSVRIGSAAVHADAMVVVSHVKGHEATGFGGALKNVGMGLGSRSAKQRMHSDFSPQPSDEKCTACGRCVQWCPVNAITIAPDRVARVDYELCYGCGECVAACPHGAIKIQWETTPAAIQEKIVEHAAGALDGKQGKVTYLSFVTNVTPDCDCWHFSDASVVPDIGVLASTDIVAIEQAAYDLVTQAIGLAGTRGEGMPSGTDKFTEITGIDGTAAIRYAEEMGLGTRRYEIVTIE